MALYQAWVNFSDELDVLISEFEKFAIEAPITVSSACFDLASECLLEGLLSRTWQAWCAFCRTCVIESCAGTVDGNANPITACPLAFSEFHVSAAAIAAKRNNVTIWGQQNLVLRFEPTWGDTDVLADILPKLAPSNQLQLSSAFSSAHAAAKVIQKIRNASAHNHAQAQVEVTALMPSFLAYLPTHPIQALYWVEPIALDYLIIYAIEELRDSALSAIS